MKVWTVERWFFQETELKGIYDSEEKANEKADEINRKLWKHYPRRDQNEEAVVNEWDVE